MALLSLVLIPVSAWAQTGSSAGQPAPPLESDGKAAAQKTTPAPAKGGSDETYVISFSRFSPPASVMQEP